MRFLLFALVVSLSLSWGLSASPEYKSCATPSYDVTITNITADVWPPEKGKDLILNITGVNSKNITAGDYTIQIKVDGIPLPSVNGNIDTFHPLPWPAGNLSFSYSQEIPASAPSGQYALHISALDQDKTGIFCITLNFKISSEGEVEGSAKRGRLAISALNGQGVRGSLRRGLEVANGVKKLMPMPKMKRRL